jgi:Leu/Phe-tRNA-protein transferase
LVAWMISTDVRLHGFRGQLAFTNRIKIEPERLEEYRREGYFRWSASYIVPRPPLRWWRTKGRAK